MRDLDYYDGLIADCLDREPNMTPNGKVQADSRGFMREVAPGTES